MENNHTEENIKILDVLQQMPNEAIKDFFVKKINKQIQDCQEPLISILKKTKEANADSQEVKEIQECISDIIEIENSKWINFSNKNILDKINLIARNLESSSDPLNLKDEIKKLIESTSSWIEVERNFLLTKPDHYYSLYKYIHPENIQKEVLNELTELYKEMF